MRLILILLFAVGIDTLLLAEPQILREISYKVEAETQYEKERCTLDLYLPGGDVEDFPTVIWFHGGGLKNGPDNDLDITNGLAAQLNAEGIAMAAVLYRLSPKVNYPAYIEDAAASVAWVVGNIAEHGGDPEVVFVSGHSAGGYLSLMVGLDADYLAPHELVPGDLAGYIPVAGQTVTHSTVREERGIPATTPIVDEAAPSYHVAKNAPPFLCIVADDDLPVRVEENLFFVAAMEATGHESTEFLQVSDRNHRSIAAEMSTEGDPGFAALLKFVQKHRP